MSLFTARNEKLAEPLLVVLDSDVVLVVDDDDDDDDDDDCTLGGDSGQEYSSSCTPTKRPATGCCSNNRRTVSESSSTSCCFLSYFHSKFIFAGFLFGALMELAYVLANSLEEANDATTTTTTSITTTNSKKPNPIRAEHWQDVFFFQLCFLFSYVMFVVYMLVIARRGRGAGSVLLLKKNDKELTTTLSLQIMAVNWTVGIVLGLAITVSFLFGPQVFLMRQQDDQQEHNPIWQVLVIMIIGIALCLVAYGTVKDMQIYFRGGTPPPPPGACCDRKTNNNDKTPEQEARLDVKEEDPSWIEARIV